MVEEGIRVKFVGEDGNLSKTLGSLTDQLKRFQAGLKEATNVESFERLQRAITATKQRIDSLKGMGTAGEQFKKFSTNAVDATNALGNFSRIAQDAPYGFMGIANNINPALESFQRLQKETGSTSAALSAMAAGLTGPAGIGLAIGVVSSLLVAFGDTLFSAGEKAKYLSDDLRLMGSSADAVKGQIDDLSSSLSFLNSFSNLRIQLAGGNDVAVLEQQIRNVDAALAQTINARTFYLQDQSRELTSRLANAVVGSDEAKQAQEALDKNAAAIQASIDKESDLRKQRGLLQLQAQVTQKRLNEEELKEADAQAKRLKAKNDAAFREYEALMRKYRQIVAQDKLDQNNPDLAPALPKITEDKEGSRRAVEAYLRNLRNAFEDASRDGGISASDLFRGELDFQDFQRNGGRTATQLVEDQKRSMIQLAGIVAGVVTPAFQNMFAAIAAGEDPLKQFFKGIGDAINNLMQQLLQVALQAAVFSLFTGGSFGSIFKNILGGARPFATGGIVYGPTLGLMGEYANAGSNPEVVAPLNKLRGLLADVGGANGGVLTARGNDLILVQSRTERRQGRVR